MKKCPLIVASVKTKLCFLKFISNICAAEVHWLQQDNQPQLFRSQGDLLGSEKQPKSKHLFCKCTLSHTCAQNSDVKSALFRPYFAPAAAA